MEKIDGETKIVILAAGKGKRMQSEDPKVLAKLAGKHLIRHLLLEVEKVSSEKPIVIVGYKAELVKKELGDSCIYVEQKEQLGTGHAVLSASAELRGARRVVILNGDQPFTTAATMRKLAEERSPVTMATIKIPDFLGWREVFLKYGRTLRDPEGQIKKIVEYKDASEDERKITELNVNDFCFEVSWLLAHLKKLKNDNVQKEYYLTGVFEIARDEGITIESIQIDPREALGANTKEELEILERFA